MKKNPRGFINHKAAIILLILISSLNKLIAQNTSYNANTSGIGGFFNAALGIQTQGANTGFAFYNTSAGYQSMFTNTDGGYNTAHGYRSLYSNTTGGLNTGIGFSALYSNTTAFGNTAVGAHSLFNSTGNTNSAFGASALYANTTGYGNVAIGESSLNATTTGYWNTAIGSSSLYGNTTGYLNTGLGLAANVGSGNLTNATAVGAYSVVNNSNSIQLGNSSVTSIYAGVGTTAKLITGGLQVTGGSLVPGYVLTSDASGNATWQPGGGGGGPTDWHILGNTGTVDGVNFIGTTDNVPFNIRVFNETAGRIDNTMANTFYGFRAGRDNTGGTNNTAHGFQALETNQKGIDNTAVGSNALYNNSFGDYNTAVGSLALYRNSTGPGNTAVGYSALLVNNTEANTAVGFKALYNTSTGNCNNALGFLSLYSNTTGFRNVAMGHLSLYNNTTGFQNDAYGDAALYSNVNGYHNCGFGANALFYNTSGNFNIGIGYAALQINATGSNNTAVGFGADVTASNFTNATALGYFTLVNASDKVVIGSNTPGIVIGGYAGWSNYSDGRFKENIKENVPGLDFITKLRPVTYNINIKKLDEHLKQNMPDSLKAKRLLSKEAIATAATRQQTGFIAQEVEKTANEIGYDFDGINTPKNPTDNYSLTYSQFVVPLVVAVQELSQQNNDLRKELNELKALVKNSIAENKTGSIKISGDAAQLFQNAPNPFSQSTMIKYSIPADAKMAMLTISRLDGIKVAEYDLVNKGGQPVEISGGKLSAGTYVYSLSVNGEMIDSKKMILTR